MNLFHGFFCGLFFFFSLLVGSHSKTWTTITVDGNHTDWPVDSIFSGSDSSLWYFTWNATDFFFGLSATDVSQKSNPYLLIVLYIDSFPDQNPMEGQGSSIGVKYGDQTPYLPFNGKYFLKLKVDGSRNLYFWNNFTTNPQWEDVDRFGETADITIASSGNFLEGRISRDSLGIYGAVYNLYICGAMMDFQPNHELIYNVLPAGNHSSGYFTNFYFYNWYSFVLVDDISPTFPSHLNSYVTATAQDGDFDSCAVWYRGVIPGNRSVIYVGNHIRARFGIQVHLKGLIVQPKGIFSSTRDSSMVFSNEAVIQNNGVWEIDTPVVFEGNTTILPGNSIVFGDLTVNGYINFEQNCNISGTLTMLAKGVGKNNIGPFYSPGSTLRYTGGGIHPRGSEWSANGPGPGFPNQVLIDGNSTLNLGAYPTPCGVQTLLKIFAGSTLSMWSSSVPLTIGEGAVLNNEGTIVLSSSTTGNLLLQTKGNNILGNIQCTGTGTVFIGNDKFNKPTIKALGPTDIVIGSFTTLTVVNPVNGSTYVWTPGNIKGATINVTVAGSYSVRVTDSSNCVADSDSIQIKTHAPPTTAVPTTAVPTTAVPTTAVPTTAVPTTAVPTTAIPTTAIPTTAVPTTAVPTTAVPTTAIPTTGVPTTAVPTTAVPTTAVPTTSVPTTAYEPTDSDQKGLSRNAIFGIVGACLAVVALVLILIPVMYYLKKKKKQREEDRELLLAVF